MSLDHTVHTHAYAVVRVKVLATQAAGDTAAQVSDAVADAVARSARKWLRPVCGTVRTESGLEFSIEQVEYADEIAYTMVDHCNDKGDVVKSELFDCTGAPLPNGFTTTKEAQLAGALDAVLAELDGLAPDITSETIENNHLARARYLAEVATGRRKAFDELENLPEATVCKP